MCEPMVELPVLDSHRFRILHPLDRGGISRVYVAYDEELNREVALKQLRRRYADDSESRARLLFEAEVTAGLEHPGVVPVYGLGQYADGRPFFTMRLIRGDDFSMVIKQLHQTDRPRGGRRNCVCCWTDSSTSAIRSRTRTAGVSSTAT